MKEDVKTPIYAEAALKEKSPRETSDEASLFSLFRSTPHYKMQKVLITGGSRGLGLALAKELVEQGAYIALMARDKQELARAKEMLLKIDPKAKVLLCPCDITVTAQVDACLQQLFSEWNKLDVVINNAGAILVGPFDSMNEKDFRAQMELHLFAVIHMVKQVLPEFRKQGVGKFINICSMGGRVAVPHMLPYDASKFALSGFSQGLAAELAKENITVTTVYPALMKTGSPIQAVFKGDAAKEFDWFATSDYFPGITLPAQTAAKKILKAAQKDRAELVLSAAAYLRLVGQVVAPELMHWTMSTINKFMPENTDDIYKTGAQVAEKARVFKKYFAEAAKMAEEEFNQKRKTNAKFALGLNKTQGESGAKSKVKNSEVKSAKGKKDAIVQKPLATEATTDTQIH